VTGQSTPRRPAGIGVATWQRPEHLAWSYRHVREVLPTARIGRGSWVRALSAASGDCGADEAQVRELLSDPSLDGLLIVRDGAILAEEYRRDMRPDDTHLLQSVSKSLTGALCATLLASGELDEAALVVDLLPELAGSSFDGATVRHLLDMRAGIRFEEDYDDPASDLRAWEAQLGWGPEPPAWPNAIAFLRRVGKSAAHGGTFEYRSVLTDVLGMVVERAAGMPFAEALAERIWAPMGAEHDAHVTVDRDGVAVTDGGISATLRDVARFAMLLLDDGVVDGRRVLPEGWVQDTLDGDPDVRRAFALTSNAAGLEGGHYRNQLWVPPGGDVLLGLGIHGQILFVAQRARIVAVVLSTWPIPVDEGRYEAAKRALLTLAERLVVTGVARSMTNETREVP
jgi:CubicO group peptidase (beta-lactamase class C family)